MPKITSDRKLASPTGECPLQECAITVHVGEEDEGGTFVADVDKVKATVDGVTKPTDPEIGRAHV